MRAVWPLLLVGALLLVPGVRGDPAISSPGAHQGLATWTFSNAANYTVTNATLADSAASLAWTTAAATDTSEADFAAALVLANVNVASSPGDVVIANTSQPGPVQTLVWQPSPANLSDNYLYKGNGGNPNFGTAPDMMIGNWGGGSWGRGVIAFPSLPLPTNATVVGANLQLFMFNPVTPGVMYFSAHRMLDNWTETGSNWDTRDGVILWNTTGGDFDPTALDTSAGVAATPGWFTWNITSLAIGWWTKAAVNDGLMVRQVGDATSILGEKDFYSSDTTNASYRPRLILAYTTPGSRGHLESRPIDAGGKADWGRISWNATLPSGTSVFVRTRTGNTSTVDASWSPWSPSAGSGLPIASPVGRYLQYSLDLFTSSTASPAVHDVSVGFARYAAAGRIDTQDFGPSSLQAWGVLSMDAAPPSGTSVALEYSQDGGAGWLPVATGTNLSSALPLAIRIRILLATNDTTAAPTVRAVSLAFRLTASSGGGPGPGPGPASGATGYAWLAALASLAIVGLVLAGVLLRAAAFKPTGLFLIHADGRLVARLGTEDLQDELAATAVFTLVLKFVRDSFRGPGGTGGELKSLQIDQRSVSIARGRFLYLALVSEGPRPSRLSARMYRFLGALEAGHAARLERWDGLREGNEGLEAELAEFLRYGCRHGPRRRP